jgi:PAS domain S-box-containing protein
VPFLTTTTPGAALDPVAAPAALAEGNLAFRRFADALPHMVWSTLPDGYHDYYNAQWYEFTGVSPGSTDGDEWNGMFHPEDQPRAWEAWQACLASGEPYHIEYRLRHRSGEYRWTIGRAQPVRDEQGDIIRWMGTCTDIHEAKQHAAHNDILSRELSHRIKNIFAVISGLVGMSAREDPGQKSFARKLQERVAALGRAHEFVRPHSAESLPKAPTDSLHGILLGILSPYPAMDDGRITIEGPDVRVDDRGATPLALLVHELATNAMKYGALTSAEGRVRIETRVDGDQLTLQWQESGGPRLSGPPSRQGFGTKLSELSIVQQLGGSIARDWHPDGLVVCVAVLQQRLVR